MKEWRVINMDISGIWKDVKSTVIGIIVIVAVTVAMFKGACSFDRWWEIILIILGFLLGGGLMISDRNKEYPKPPTAGRSGG